MALKGSIGKLFLVGTVLCAIRAAFSGAMVGTLLVAREPIRPLCAGGDIGGAMSLPFLRAD